MLEHFPAKWRSVRVKKTRQTNNPEPRSDSIGTEKAPARARSDPADAIAIRGASDSLPYQRHAHRPARRLVQSAARGASRHQPVCAEAPEARSRLVAADAGQSAQGH